MSLQGQFQTAYASHQKGDLEAAEKGYRAVLADAPKHGNSLRFLGLVLHQLGRSDEGIEFLRKASKIPEDQVAVLSDLGVVYTQRGEYPTAEQVLKQALALDPSNENALTNLTALFNVMGNTGAAIEALNKAVSVSPNDMPLKHSLAKCLSEAGQDEEALALCDEVLAHHPRVAQVLATKGACLTQMGRFEAAIEVLARAATADPPNYLLLCNLGYCKFLTGDFGESVQILERACGVQNRNSRAIALLAHALCRSEKVEQALERCQRALEKNPGDTEVLSVLPYVLGRLGRWEEYSKLMALSELIQSRTLETPSGYESLEIFNRELAAEIRSDQTLLASPSSKSTQGGFQTATTTGVDGTVSNKLIGALSTHVSANFDRLSRAIDPGHPFIDSAPDHWSLHAWGVVLKNGGHQNSHIHPSAWMSGVYYVQVPRAVLDDSDGKGGWIEFGRPSLSFAGDDDVFPKRLIQPDPGQVIMFPSYMPHQTIPFSSDEDRISFAFDVVPREA